MKLIGYWMRDLQDGNLPVPQELVGEMSSAVREAVCAYLRAGKLFEMYCGLSWCRFDCGVDDREMGHREFTDGEWVWPEGLVHYVSAHGILLPAEFIARATSGKMVDVVSQSYCYGHGRRASLDFWVEWSGQRRSSMIRQRLQDELAAARAAAEAAEPALIEKLVEEVLKSETEGSAPCVYAGCTRRALVGRRICARHMLSGDELRWQTAPRYALPAEILRASNAAPQPKRSSE
jgi:hypothetical protein